MSENADTLSLGWKAAQDNAAVLHGLEVSSRPLPALTGMTALFWLLFATGQSKGIFQVTHPPKTTVPPAGLVARMLGRSVRPARETDIWYPMSKGRNDRLALHDAVATMDNDTPRKGTLYDPATWVGTPTGGVGGEAANIVAAYEFLMRARALGHPTAGLLERTPVIGTVGHGGMRFDQLLQETGVMNPENARFLNRLRTRSYFETLHNHLTGDLGFAGNCITLPWWYLDLGQADAAAHTPYADVTERLGLLRDFVHGLARDLFGQQLSPLMMMIQTGQHWILHGDLSVPQAQLDFSRANPEAVVVGPSHAWPGKMSITYPDPADSASFVLPSDRDLNEHDDGNVAVWKGSKAASIAERIFIRHESYEHPRILRGSWKGRTAIVSWHADHQIALLKTWIGYRHRMLADYGIEFSQGGESIGFDAAVVFGRRSLSFVFDRPPVSSAAGAPPVQIHVGRAGGRANVGFLNPDLSWFRYKHHHQDYAARNPDPALMTPQELAIEEEVIAELGVKGARLWTDDADPAGTGLRYRNYDWAPLETFMLDEIA
jgi:hypothetical protein